MGAFVFSFFMFLKATALRLFGLGGSHALGTPNVVHVDPANGQVRNCQTLEMLKIVLIIIRSTMSGVVRAFSMA